MNCNVATIVALSRNKCTPNEYKNKNNIRFAWIIKWDLLLVIILVEKIFHQPPMCLFFTFVRCMCATTRNHVKSPRKIKRNLYVWVVCWIHSYTLLVDTDCWVWCMPPLVGLTHNKFYWMLQIQILCR